MTNMNRRELFQMGAGAAALSITGLPAFAENSNVITIRHSEWSGVNNFRNKVRHHPEYVFESPLNMTRIITYEIRKLRLENPGKIVRYFQDFVPTHWAHGPNGELPRPPMGVTYAADIVDVIGYDGKIKRIKDRYATA